jgi:hypothetical protein
MPFRFITKSIHTYLIDYPVAILLMVAPFLLKLGKSSPVGVDPSHGTAAAGPHGPPDGAPPGHALLAASLGGARIGCNLYHRPPLSISLGFAPGTTGFSPLRFC